jgi:hypothetical protein
LEGWFGELKNPPTRVKTLEDEFFEEYMRKMHENPHLRERFFDVDFSKSESTTTTTTKRSKDY